jgi:hypothetical protein
MLSLIRKDDDVVPSGQRGIRGTATDEVPTRGPLAVAFVVTVDRFG